MATRWPCPTATSKVDEFVQNEAQRTAVVASHSVVEMGGILKRPRRVTLMVEAGTVVDQTIYLIVPHLVPGDVIISAGFLLIPTTWQRPGLAKPL